jgi:hypothetical protein
MWGQTIKVLQHDETPERSKARHGSKKKNRSHVKARRTS